MNDEPKCIICEDGAKRWFLDGLLHRLNGPAIIHPDGEQWFYIDGKYIEASGTPLSVGQAVPWYNDSVAIVIKQINPILFQILAGNKKQCLFYQEYK